MAVDKTPITAPKIDETYFLNSIEVLEEAIEDQPDYRPFIELQLSFYERLGWPAEAEDALRRAERFFLNDQKFFNQKITFFQVNRKYEQLAQELKKYPVSSQLPSSLQLVYTDALIQMGDFRNAKEQLNLLMSFEEDSGVTDFLIPGFLAVGDTIQSIQLLYQQKESNINRLLALYRQLNLEDSIINLFEQHPQLFQESTSIQLVASSYLHRDSLTRVEQLLSQDTTVIGKILLAEAYEKQFKLFSASRVFDELINKQPEEILWMKKRASLANRRGFYESAMYYYGQALKIDSTDQEAQQQFEQIKEKIAYLRQQQQEQQILPMLGLDSLKKGM